MLTSVSRCVRRSPVDLPNEVARTGAAPGPPRRRRPLSIYYYWLAPGPPRASARAASDSAAAEAKATILEKARVKNVTALLHEARARSNDVRNRTCARVKLLATHSVKALLEAEEAASVSSETAVAQHTLRLERHTRHRQQHLLAEFDTLRKREASAVAELRARALVLQRAEQRGQQAAEQQLREQVLDLLRECEYARATLHSGWPRRWGEV